MRYTSFNFRLPGTQYKRLPFLYSNSTKIANEFFVTLENYKILCYNRGKYQLPGGSRMELGEKLREARLEAGLSQRALCGDVITRNMLSQIENGSAKPSMATLQYLAGQLGKPVGYFLEEQALLSPNSDILLQARQAYAHRQHRQVLLILSVRQRLLLRSIHIKFVLIST